MSSNTKTNKIPLAHIFFLIAGILLVVYYLLSEGMPSLGNNIVSLMKFIVELFVLILLIGFYFYFLFGGKGCEGTIKSIAPALLVLIVVGAYSMNFGSSEASSVISGIAKMFYVLMIACGFTFLFVHNKVLGLTFAYASVVYACFVSVSYTVVVIMDLVNGGSFSTSKLFETICYATSLCLLFAGAYKANKNKALTLN